MSLRVEWALKLKGVEYEYIAEDLSNKSERLLKANPIYKKVPVLVHGGKPPLPESLIILQYIDDTWKENPLLPEDPYQRATARFWAKYADEKPWNTIFGVFTKKTGEEQEEALKEAKESLKPLEEILKGKKFFGGESIGYLDIVLGWMSVWVPMTEEILSLTFVDANEMPLLYQWFQAFLDVPLVKEKLPPKHKLLPFNKAFHESLMSS